MSKHTGAPVHAVYTMPRIRRSLVNAIDQPTPRVVVKRQEKRRPPVKSGDPMTDARLAEMRGDRELRGASIRECASKFGISVARAYNLCDYETRWHVEPA
jgi:hypothetical protein